MGDARGYQSWVILFAGATFGFFVSIVANLATPTFGSYFARSKLGWIERSRRRALKQFNFIQRFRNGTEDQYMYFVAQWGYILLYGVLATFFEVISSLNPQIDLAFASMLALLVAVIRGVWVHMRLYLWYWRMNNFEEYRLSLERKWPDLKAS
jgi:hypothetical protein